MRSPHFLPRAPHRLRGVSVPIAVYAAAVALAAGALPAQRVYTRDELVAKALGENLDLRSARLRADSARAEVRIARAWPNPAAAIAPATPYQYTIGAPFDLGPQRLYRVRAAGEGSAAAATDIRDAERQIRFAVRAAFYDLVLADTLREVTREAHDIFRDLLAADSARVRAGDAPESNLVKSELELAKSEAALAGAEATVRAARIALQLAVGITRPDTGFRVAGSLSVQAAPALDELAAADVPDSVVNLRADVFAASQRTRASEASRRYASWLLLPVPELTLVHQYDPPFNNNQAYAVGLGAQVPVWNWFSGERSRSAASLELSRVAEQRARAQARAEVAAALDQYRAAALLARRLDRRLMDKAKGALETARYASSRGALSYVELLDAVRTYGEIRVDAATAGHDYWVSAYAVARSLDREVVRP